MEVPEQFRSERAWLAAALAAVAALVSGSVAFPGRVYDGFIWQYFWGPVYADAHNAACAVKTATGVELLGSATACRAVGGGAVVAEPGYTPVSEVGYMVVLLFMLVGVFFLLRRLNVAEDRGLFYALVPFMLFGGALRVVEDAFDAVPAGVDPAVTYPANVFLISPVIYVTVFVITLAALLGAVELARRGVVDTYHKPLAAAGGVAFAATFGYLLFLGLTTDYVGLHAQILVVDLVLASVIAVAVFRAINEVAPSINAGTRGMGLVVLWAHAVDGVANVVAADWMAALGVNLQYSAKHPANRFIIALTEGILPGSVAASIGTSWPFLLVKVVVAVGVVWVFDDRILEESPRYAILLLVAVVAVGLGPGTRDMLRTTFGI